MDARTPMWTMDWVRTRFRSSTAQASIEWSFRGVTSVQVTLLKASYSIFDVLPKVRLETVWELWYRIIGCSKRPVYYIILRELRTSFVLHEPGFKFPTLSSHPFRVLFPSGGTFNLKAQACCGGCVLDWPWSGPHEPGPNLRLRSSGCVNLDLDLRSEPQVQRVHLQTGPNNHKGADVSKNQWYFVYWIV